MLIASSFASTCDYFAGLTSCPYLLRLACSPLSLPEPSFPWLRISLPSELRQAWPIQSLLHPPPGQPCAAQIPASRQAAPPRPSIDTGGHASASRKAARRA